MRECDEQSATPQGQCDAWEHSSMLDEEIACDGIEQRQWHRIMNDEL